MDQIYDRGRSASREFQQEFRGINKKMRPSETEFVYAMNLSAREYPALVTREERDYITDIGRCTSPSLCSLGDGSVAYLSEDTEGEYITIDGETVYTLEPTGAIRTMVKMGSCLCVFPDGLVYNMVDKTVKFIEASVDNKFDGAVVFSPSGYDGKIAKVSETMPSKAQVGDIWYDPKEEKSYLCSSVSNSWQKEESFIYANGMDLAFSTVKPQYAVQVESFAGGIPQGEYGMLFTNNGGSYIATGISVPIYNELPESANNGDFIVVNDTVAKKCELYQFRTNRPNWTENPQPYTRIELNSLDISDKFSTGDVIEVGKYGYTRVLNSVKSSKNENGYIVVDNIGRMGAVYYAEEPIKISRNLPERLTNIIECSNRLWATDDEGHEIYACKLGDPFNWYAFSGLASDSYAITVGSGGVFTGAISYDGYPHFFKENSIIKVYGSYPFRLYALDCPGVNYGSQKSVSVLNGVVVYKGVDAFYAYSGSYPQIISSDLGNIPGIVAASAADNNAYYCVLDNNIYVFENGFWHIQAVPNEKGYEFYEETVLDMCYTGRNVIAAFTANDSVIGFGIEAPTVFLSKITGNDVSNKTNFLEKTLLKQFYLEYINYERNGYIEKAFVFRNKTNEFTALNVGETFFIDLTAYSVHELFKEDESTTIILFGLLNESEIDSEFVAGQKYKISVYKNTPISWYFETTKLGLSFPDDMYYSHFTFRYFAENPVVLHIKYDDGNSERSILPAKNNIGSYAVTVIPRNTEYISLELSGEGKFALFSITKKIEGGKNP